MRRSVNAHRSGGVRPSRPRTLGSHSDLAHRAAVAEAGPLEPGRPRPPMLRRGPVAGAAAFSSTMPRCPRCAGGRLFIAGSWGYACARFHGREVDGVLGGTSNGRWTCRVLNRHTFEGGQHDAYPHLLPGVSRFRRPGGRCSRRIFEIPAGDSEADRSRPVEASRDPPEEWADQADAVLLRRSPEHHRAVQAPDECHRFERHASRRCERRVAGL